jgi:hypothetical protein
MPWRPRRSERHLCQPTPRWAHLVGARAVTSDSARPVGRTAGHRPNGAACDALTVGLACSTQPGSEYSQVLGAIAVHAPLSSPIFEQVDVHSALAAHPGGRTPAHTHAHTRAERTCE